MIMTGDGSIFACKKVDAITIPVNTVGVMGAGLAKESVLHYPNNEVAYKTACYDRQIAIGRCFVYRIRPPSDLVSYRWIINFPTKKHWKEPSEIIYIERGLRDLCYCIRRYGIDSIAIPALGCGCGGLQWSDVSKLINNIGWILSDVKIVQYLPR